MTETEEGRRDIFVLGYTSNSWKTRSFGLFQYFKKLGDPTYIERIPIRFNFQKTLLELGREVGKNIETIIADAGTYFFCFEKKGYFPDAHLDSDGIRQYRDLTEGEREQFTRGFLQGRNTSK
jgi:hypothetical protein